MIVVNLLAVEADKSKAPALLGSVVLGDVDISDPAILVKQLLEVINGGPVTQAVHLEADHLADVRGRTLASTASTTSISVSS